MLEKDEDGKFIASCSSLEGCYSQGDTAEEAMANIRDVIEMCLQELEAEKKDLTGCPKMRIGSCKAVVSGILKYF